MKIIDISVSDSDNALIEKLMHEDKLRNRSEFIRKLIYAENIRRKENKNGTKK